MNAHRQEIAKAVSEFMETHLRHEAMMQATLEVLFAIDCTPGCDAVLVVGPPKVGKTAVLSTVARALRTEYAEQIAVAGCHPVVTAVAPAFERASLSLTTAVTIALHQLLEVEDDFGKPSSTCAQLAPMQRAARLAALLSSFEREMGNAGTRVWIIDEAQCLIDGSSRSFRDSQFEVLLSLARRSGVKLVLAISEGAFEMLDMTTLGRGCAVVRCRPYEAQEDKHQFVAIAEALFRRMHVEAYPSVRENWRLLLEGCAGSVGLLKEWLARAYAQALLDGSEVGGCTSASLTVEHLDRARLLGRPSRFAEAQRLGLEVVRKAAASAGTRARSRAVDAECTPTSPLSDFVADAADLGDRPDGQQEDERSLTAASFQAELA